MVSHSQIELQWVSDLAEVVRVFPPSIAFEGVTRLEPREFIISTAVNAVDTRGGSSNENST